jgi:uncharacterized protein with PQ loop repeat
MCGCTELVPSDTASLLVPRLQRSEIIGFLAGFGTTFAGVPDLISMLRRRSTAGMHPRMATILGMFEIFWIYYGLLIASRPVILWNQALIAHPRPARWPGGAHSEPVRLVLPQKWYRKAARTTLKWNFESLLM